MTDAESIKATVQAIRERWEKAGRPEDWVIKPIGNSETWVEVPAFDEAALREPAAFAVAAYHGFPILLPLVEEAVELLQWLLEHRGLNRRVPVLGWLDAEDDRIRAFLLRYKGESR